MKKMFMGALALLAVAAVSCNKTGDTDSATPTNDSLSVAYGDYVGSMLYNEMQQAGDEGNKEAFMKGMQMVIGSDADRNTRMGMQVALQLMSEMEQLKDQHINLNTDLVFKAFKKTFMSDSLSYDQIQTNSLEFQRQFTAARTEAEEVKKAAAVAQAAENEKAGAEYLAQQISENANIKVAENGLGYLIEVEGDGEHPTADATVEVNYTGKLIDGTVFDTTDGRGPATFNLQGVVPGFREGIMLLAKGGKATLYIPGKLAYGQNGQPGAGIGPDAMLVFDVELISFTEPAE